MKDILLKRTNATSLTDDELLLLDGLAMYGSLPLWSLRRHKFGDCFNMKTHGMSNEELNRSLTRMVSEDVLSYEKHFEYTYYTLTALGGGLWEAERTPVWDRYLQMSGSGPEGKYVLTVYAMRKEIPGHYIRLAKEIGHIPQGEMKMRSYYARNLRNHAFVQWRTFPGFFCSTVLIRQPVNSMEMLEMTVEQFENERTWWMSVRELQKFL